MHVIQKHWTAVSTLSGLISSVYRDLSHRRLNQQPQNAEPKLYLWATNPHHTQITPNQLVMVIVQPINLNVSCNLYLYSLQRTWSPPGPHLHRRIENMHPQNYYNLKGENIDIHFSFLSRGIILWGRSRYILLMRPNTVETAVQCFHMLRAYVQIFWSW